MADGQKLYGEITLDSLKSKTVLATDANGVVIDGVTGSDARYLKLDQTTPQTVTGEIKTVNSGTINRVAGLISSIVVGSRTRTYTRNASGFVTGMTDGVNTWTYTRDANNNLLSWEVI